MSLRVFTCYEVFKFDLDWSNLDGFFVIVLLIYEKARMDGILESPILDNEF